MATLTPFEKEVLAALVRACADATSGEFGFTDEAMTFLPGVDPKAFGGAFTSLAKKGLVAFEAHRVNGQEMVHQFWFCGGEDPIDSYEKAKALLEPASAKPERATITAESVRALAHGYLAAVPGSLRHTALGQALAEAIAAGGQLPSEESVDDLLQARFGTLDDAR